MPSYLISTDANKCGQVQLDAHGELLQMTMYPVAPNPDHLPAKSPGGISTQWLVQHPTLPLVVALTSYWNSRSAHLTCFCVDGGGLTKLPAESATGGREAVHAVFSPITTGSDTIALAVAHHNDGFVSFFKFSTKELPTSLMDQPAVTLELPELIAGTKHTLSPHAKTGLSKPSSHHILYDRRGKYLWIVDPNQSAIFTYDCGKDGLPVGENPMPSFIFNAHTDTPSLSWFGSIVGTMLMGLSCRPRRIALSPNGEYLFVSYETRNVIQVYGVNPQTGEIDTACLQEVSTLDDHLTHAPLVGLTFQASAELIVCGNALYVSNRANVLGVGQGENSIRVFSIKDRGRLVARSTTSVRCSGPVRHFCVSQQDGKEILVAGTSAPGKSLQTFARDMDRSVKEDQPNDWELIGEADVEVNVFFVLPMEGDDEEEIVLPSVAAAGGKTTPIVQQQQVQKKMEEPKNEQVADVISQMEEQAMNSFSHNDEDAVLVEPSTETEA